MTLTRRSVLTAGTAAAALGLGVARPPAAHARTARPGRGALYVSPGGRGDFTSVQDAVDAVPGADATIVLAPGTYREKVLITGAAAGLTLLGATGDPRDVVIVHDHANGTPRPEGGTYGTSGSATVTTQADRFTARGVTFANDWLRADHPGVTGTQAVAIKVQGDRSAFHRCRFLGHQDTLYADTAAATVLARQYFGDCYAEGDVDFVFGRATAVFERCRFHTLDRTDLGAAPYGFVFAPSTTAADPHGFLAVDCVITSGAPDAAYKLARPWVPSSDTTAVPMLTVRNSLLGAGIDAAEPYANMSAGYPWQSMRFSEYANAGPGARITDPDSRPQLTRAQAASFTRESYLSGPDRWSPWARPGAGRGGR
ncbi:pectinesterase family protein [Streptomyces sp. NPDC049040]|uniref:pectinesterase family protein n=1 Tax=Streptomyces sp. NPDC049040 TaxID=3365593 RepID=UPI0037140F19